MFRFEAMLTGFPAPTSDKNYLGLSVNTTLPSFDLQPNEEVSVLWKRFVERG